MVKREEQAVKRRRWQESVLPGGGLSPTYEYMYVHTYVHTYVCCVRTRVRSTLECTYVPLTTIGFFPFHYVTYDITRMYEKHQHHPSYDKYVLATGGAATASSGGDVSPTAAASSSPSLSEAACPQIAQDGYPLWLPRRLIKNYPPWLMRGALDPEL